MGVASSGQPTTVVGNTNQDVVQTLALLNIAGADLSREHYWQAGTIQYLYTTPFFTYTGTTSTSSPIVTGMSSIVGLTANPTYFMAVGTGIPQDTFLTAASAATVTLNQTPTVAGSASITFSQVLYPFPSDFDRPVDRTQWDKSRHWEMLGPESAQQWEWLKSGWISTGPRVRFRPFGGYFAIWPPLATLDTLSYEYQSKNWILATAAALPSKQLFTVDTDTTIFPDSLMRALIRLKYFEAKGFDTTALQANYDKQLDIAKSGDAGNPTLSMCPRPSSTLIGWSNIPDSGFGT